MRCEIKIEARTVLTLDGCDTIIPNGAILIQSGKIKEVGPAYQFAHVTSEKTFSFPHGLAMPGLVNTHTHIPMSLFRGLADDLPLSQWLEDYIFPAESKFLDADSVYWSSLLSTAELALSGTTCFADGYFYEDIVATAVEKSRMRAVLAQGVIDFPAPGVPDPVNNIKTARSFIDAWTERNSRIRPAVFCHSPYTCSPETLIAGKCLARESESLFFIHLAETKTELEQIRRERGLTPVQYLDSLDGLDGETVGVHCVWLNDNDIDLAARADMKVSHAPESEMKLASGAPPVPDLLRRGVTVSLGTDGCASNNDQDMFQEMDVATKLQKLHCLDSTALPAREVVRMSTIGGAKALGWDKMIGSIEPGKQADIIILNMRKPHLTPIYDYYSHLVYAAKGSDVQTVLVDGELIVHDGVFLPFDLEETMDRVSSVSARIKDQLR